MRRYTLTIASCIAVAALAIALVGGAGGSQTPPPIQLRTHRPGHLLGVPDGDANLKRERACARTAAPQRLPRSAIAHGRGQAAQHAALEAAGLNMELRRRIATPPKRESVPRRERPRRAATPAPTAPPAATTAPAPPVDDDDDERRAGLRSRRRRRRRRRRGRGRRR